MKVLLFSAIIIDILLLFKYIVIDKFYAISYHKFIDKTSFIFFAWTVTNGGLERERVKMESSWSFKSS